MERSEQRKVVEALVLAAPEPIPAARIAQVAPDCTPALAKELVEELNELYAEQEHAFEIWEVAGGYQLRTRAEFSGYLQQLQKHRPLRLSRAALETLAIVAYKQPVTRGEVEQVRGVDVGAVVKSLMERQLVRITGQREVPGRPMLYGTTRRFLEIFGLESLKGLPTLRELEEIARERGIENPEEVLGLDLVEGQAEDAAEATEGEPLAGEGASSSEESVVGDAEELGALDAGDGTAVGEVFEANDVQREPAPPRFAHGEEPYSPFAEDDASDAFAGEDTPGAFGAGGDTLGGFADGEEGSDEASNLERE